MLPSLVLLASTSLGMAAGEGPDRSQLAQLIAAAQQDLCHDVGFEYEGQQVIPGELGREAQKLQADGVRFSFSGTFTRREDGATLTEIYSLDKKYDMPSRITVALLEGVGEDLSQKATEKRGEIAARKQGPLSHYRVGDYHVIWAADKVLDLAKSVYQYEFRGTDRIGDSECLVVRFRLELEGTPATAESSTKTFWVDINRGGHVVRSEDHWGGRLARTATVELGRFGPRPGKICWLPISGRVESHVAFRAGKQEFLKEPVYHDTHHMIPATVRFDRNLTDEQFTVKARPGDVVSDEVRKARYEFGQYMVRPAKPTTVPSDTEVKANLDRMLKDSSLMAKELKASSPLRDGSGWASYWPWAIAGLAVAGSGFVLYRRWAA